VAKFYKTCSIDTALENGNGTVDMMRAALRFAVEAFQKYKRSIFLTKLFIQAKPDH
jgi:hypothetical protein